MKSMSKDFLKKLPKVAHDLSQIFKNYNFELFLVGGYVRSLLLNQCSTDLDFTTNAKPHEIVAIMNSWADNLWEVGIKFGTIALQKNGYKIEITTYRREVYNINSRNPVVKFGTSLQEDLMRRDFTINALALDMFSGELIDIVNGKHDLKVKILRTPISPTISFNEDPLRIMRAARFASQLNFHIEPQTEQAMKNLVERIDIISNERIRDEIIKLIIGANPVLGIDYLQKTTVLKKVLPEVEALRMKIDTRYKHKDVYSHTMTVLEQAIGLEDKYQHSNSLSQQKPDFILRFAALMHDVGKPLTRKFENGGTVSFYHHDIVGAKLTRKRMQKLRFDKATIKKVSRLIELHLRFFGYSNGAWTDSAIRRYVTDAGDVLENLHKLTRADVTTKNKKKASYLSSAYDDLEQSIQKLQKKEELKSMRPDLNGHEIMEILNIKPGPILGKAYKFLLEERIEHGKLDKNIAIQKLKSWWNQI